MDIEAFMKRVVAAEKGEDDESIPDVPPPLLSPDAGYVTKTWLHFRMHHVYPEAGGYNDQDADLMDDWSSLNLWYLRLSQGVELHADQGDLEFMDVMDTMHG